MKKLSFFIVLILLKASTLFSQIGISTDASTPDNSAILDVKSTNKGMLVPRMTLSQRNAISNPAKGLILFCTDNGQFYFNSGTSASPSWIILNTQWIANGTNLSYNEGSVGIGTNLPAAKLDVNGNLAINGTPVINASGQWVGSPSGLVGPQGPPGPQGPTGPQGPAGPAVSTSALCVSSAPVSASCSLICGAGHLVSGTCTYFASCNITSNTGSCSATGNNQTHACCCLCKP
jgi:hypothetical protein